jgi:hypothetical protein
MQLIELISNHHGAALLSIAGLIQPTKQPTSLRMNTRHIESLTSAIVLSLLAALPARALSNHTWVSSLGNDSTGTGTYAQPYATFAQAVSQTAAGGVVSAVGPGDYGAVTIQQSVTIDGGEQGATITFGGAGEGIFVNLPTTGTPGTVILRHLAIDGVAGAGLDGIYFEGLGNLVVENCTINACGDLGIGIGSTAAENVVVKDTTITGCVLGYRVFQGVGPDQSSLRNVQIVNASNAAVFNRCGRLEMSNCHVTQSDIALQADTNSTIVADTCVLSYNTYAVISYSGSAISISNCEMLYNVNGTFAAGGAVLSAQNNIRAGNVTAGAPTNPMGLF